MFTGVKTSGRTEERFVWVNLVCFQGTDPYDPSHPTKPKVYLLQEGRVNPQVLGDHVQTEKVSINSSSSHGHPVKVLVFLWSQAEETPALLLALSTQIREIRGSASFIWSSSWNHFSKTKQLTGRVTVQGRPQHVSCPRREALWIWSNALNWSEVFNLKNSGLPLRSPELWRRRRFHQNRTSRSPFGPPWTDGSWTPRRSDRNHHDPGEKRQVDKINTTTQIPGAQTSRKIIC